MVKHLNSEMKQQQIEWRRAKVLELSSQGYTQSEIGKKLQLDRVTVHRDMHVCLSCCSSSLYYHLDCPILLYFKNSCFGIW
jgi:hypothetical protein